MVIFCKSFIKLLINEKDKLPFFYLFTANLSLEERPNFQLSDKICPTDIKNHILQKYFLQTTMRIKEVNWNNKIFRIQ